MKSRRILTIKTGPMYYHSFVSFLSNSLSINGYEDPKTQALLAGQHLYWQELWWQPTSLKMVRIVYDTIKYIDNE